MFSWWAEVIPLKGIPIDPEAHLAVRRLQLNSPKMNGIDRIVQELMVLATEGAQLLSDGQKPDLNMGEYAPRYENWYSKSLAAVRQVCPARILEFTEAYRYEKRPKEIQYDTYTISDYLLSLRVKFYGELVFNPSRAFAGKMLRQVGIVAAALELAPSVLRDIHGVLQSELLDSDITAARKLLKAKHLRAAGVVCGVALETHLKARCASHCIKVAKKEPGISDLNDLLKGAGVYDVPMWRLIQRLADIRNLCGHAKDREPKPDEVEDLISGANKVLKEVN